MRVRRTTRTSVGVRLAVVPLAVVSFLSYAVAPAQASVPTLQYTYAQTVPWFDQGEGPANPPGCDPATTSNVPFSGTSAITGTSYGSTMTVNGSVQLGVQNQPVDLSNDPGYGFPANYGLVSDVTGTFSMASGATSHVQGTFTGVGPASLLNFGNIASCYGGSGDVFGYTGADGATLIFMHFYVRYSAQVDGQSVVGLAALTGRQVCFHKTATLEEGCGNNISLYFVYASAAPDATPPLLSPSVSPNPVLQNDGSAVAPANASDPDSGTAFQSCDIVDTAHAGTFSVPCRAVNNAGLESTASANYQVLSTAEPPDTVIDSAPTGVVKATDASIVFHSPQSDSTFNAAWTAQARPVARLRSTSVGSPTDPTTWP